MTFHEICKYSTLDANIFNYKFNVSAFIQNIQKVVSIVVGPYVWHSAF